MVDSKRINKMPYLIALAVIIGIAIFVLRSPQISNALKRMILPKLEMASGKRLIAQKIYINIYPFFIEAKGLKVFDENGERILFAKRVKAYIEPSGLLSKNISIRRLVIKEPEVTTSKEQIEDIIENVKAYAAKKNDTSFKVNIRSVELMHGSTNFHDNKTKTVTDVDGLSGELILGKFQKIRASAEKIKLQKTGWPEIISSVDVNLTVKGETIEIHSLIIESFGSKITGSGEYRKDRTNFKTDMDLFVMTLKKIFKLGNSGDGRINASGNIYYAEKEITLDLDLKGDLYIQTLMELLKVRQRIEGLVSFKGEIKGSLSDIKGLGSATLYRGNLFGVDIDTIKCMISYADGTMKFSDGDGRLYNGRAMASVSITLPVVNFFTIDIDFANVDSTPLFKLIGWDPGLQNGKVKGSLSSSGAKFDPQGWFEYKNTEEGKDVRGRVKDMEGKYAKQGAILSFTDLKLETGKSRLDINGYVNIQAKTLDIKGTLKTSDISDISSPYYEKLKGTGDFTGKLNGAFDDPEISGNIKIHNPIIENYNSGLLDADISYRKNLLVIREINVKGDDEIHKLKGSIFFNKAERLFDLSYPEFKMEASLKNADLEKLVKIFYPDFMGKGKLKTYMKIGGSGDNPEVIAKAVVEKAALYKVPFDSSSFEFRYADKELNFTEMKFKRGNSLINTEATLDKSGNFSYKAISDKLMISDFIQREIHGDIILSVKTEGHGSFDNPSVFAEVKVIGGKLKGRSVGSGFIKASIDNKDIKLDARMINEKLNIAAKGRFENDIPWEAEVDIQKGRYDIIAIPFLSDVPENFMLSLNGKASLKGSTEHISASALIRHIALSMYEYSFSNEKEINLVLNDRYLDLNKITIRSGNTSLNIAGNLVIGERYDLLFEGSSKLFPFKGLSRHIGLIKGDAEFVFSIAGDWDEPRINGGLSVTNGSFKLEDYHHRVSSLTGYLYIDNDKMVLQKLSGEIGGGNIEITGIVYMKKFSFKQFYVEAGLDNITTSVSKDFTVNFGGNILYKGRLESQMISGDIKINRVRYKERTEWKSWLLKVKQTEKYKSEISEFEKAELNIRIIGKDNIFIDNNVARATASVDMVLRGMVYRPILLGRLETKEGTIYFRNNEFRILNASADFSDPNRINPFMMIAAETIAKGYKIKMNLEGYIDHFNMSLSSDPPLNEMDILALLTVGRMGSDLKGLEGGIGASEATSFVTGRIQDVIEERFRTITGLDRLQIDPYVSKTTGTIEPRVTVSKRLMGEKVFVTYTTSVGSTEEQIIKLKYLLNRNISLIGVRDERGILGGDIRFRFEFK